MPNISLFDNSNAVVENATASPQRAYLRNAPTIQQYENATPVDYDRYNKYLGTLPSFTNEYDHNEILARTQTGWDMADNATVQTLSTITGEVVTLTGAVLQLPIAAYKATEGAIKGEDVSFKDVFSEGFGADIMNASIDFQNYIRDEFKIYQTNEAQNGLALTDATWWASNAPSIASVVASMIVPLGAAKLITGLGNALLKGGSKLLANQATKGIAKGAAKVLGNTSRSLGKGLTSNFAEKATYTAIGTHADIFVEVAHGFKDKVAEYERLGYDYEQASNRAGEWAANAYRDGVIVGAAFNVLEAKLMLGKGKRFTRVDNNIDTHIGNYIDTRKTGVLGDISTSSTVKEVAKSTKKGLRNSKLFEGTLNIVNEGVEEMRVDFVMQNADQRVRINNNMPLLDMDMDVISRLGNFVTDSKNYTSFVFGALGAGITKGITDLSNRDVKDPTTEYIQRSLNTIQDIDNIISTQLGDQYKPIDANNPNGIRIHGENVASPIHDIAQAILRGSSEIGSTSNRYLKMLDSLSDEELTKYFNIKPIDVADTRSFISSAISELDILEDTRKSVTKQYDNNQDIKNKEAKKYYETALRYSNDYFKRQSDYVKEQLANTIETDPAYKKYSDSLKHLTSNQQSISKNLINLILQEDRLREEIALSNKDIDKAKIHVPSKEQIDGLSKYKDELEKIRIEINNELTTSINRDTNIEKRLDEITELLKDKNISKENSDILNTEWDTISEESQNNTITQAKLKKELQQRQVEIEQSISLIHDIESNKELYAKYETLIVSNEQEFDERRKLVIDGLNLKLLQIQTERKLIEDRNKDEQGIVSEDYKLASQGITDFITAYYRSSIVNKEVQAYIDKQISNNNAELEDIKNGAFDTKFEELKPTVREMLDITSVDKITKELNNVTTKDQLNALTKNIKDSDLYEESNSKTKTRIDKKIESKEKELNEIYESRNQDVNSNVSITIDEKGSIVKVTNKYKYKADQDDRIPISYEVGSFVIMPNGEVVKIVEFERIDDKVFAIDEDNNRANIEDLFKQENINNLTKLSILVDRIDSNVDTTLIQNLIDVVINLNTTVDDLIKDFDTNDIPIIIETLGLLDKLSDTPIEKLSNTPYNRLSKLKDILILKQELNAYNHRFYANFEQNSINATYDTLLRHLYSTNLNNDNVISSNNKDIITLNIDDTSIKELLDSNQQRIYYAIHNTIVSSINTSIINNATIDLETFSKTLLELYKANTLSQSVYIKFVSLISRIKQDQFKDEDATFINDLLNDEQYKDIHNELQAIIILYNANEQGISTNEIKGTVSVDELNTTISNGCIDIQTQSGEDITKFFNENIQQAVNAIYYIYNTILANDIESKVNPYSIIKYYIDQGFDSKQIADAYRNIQLMISSIKIANNYIKGNNNALDNVSISFKQMFENIASILNKTAISIETKNSDEIKTIIEDLLQDSTKFNNNGVRIETPIFDQLAYFEENGDLSEEVDVAFVDKNNKQLDRKLTVYDLITIQNNIRKGTELYIRKHGLNGYATYYKYQGGYVQLERINYPSGNLIEATSSGFKTVYSTPSFKKATSLLTQTNTVEYNGLEYSAAGELKLLYNILVDIKYQKGSAKKNNIKELSTILNELYNQHNEQHSDFIWKHILDSLIELDKISEHNASISNDNTLSYEQYFDNVVFVDRLIEILKPIYVHNRTKFENKYIDYNSNESYNNNDIEIIENRIRRAHNNFISQYKQRIKLKSYVSNSFKPVKIVLLNNPSLNYIDIENSQNLLVATNKNTEDTNSISYIHSLIDDNGNIEIDSSNNIDEVNKARLKHNLNLDYKAGNKFNALHLIVTHVNGNTSYAPIYSATLDKLTDLNDNNNTLNKIDNYLKFIFSSIFNSYNIASSATNDNERQIKLGNRYVSKKDIINDLSHIISTGESNDHNSKFFDFRITPNGIQIEYIENATSKIIDIVYKNNKPIKIGYGIKNVGFKYIELDSNITSNELYDMIFKGVGNTPRLLKNLTRAVPYNKDHKGFELSRTYKTIYNATEYNQHKSKLTSSKFIPVYELYANSNPDEATSYDGYFNYFVNTNGVITNIDPILDNNGNILTYNSMNPTYKMSAIIQIEGNETKSEQEILTILDTDYKSNFYQGLKDILGHKKQFKSLNYSFGYSYLDNDAIIDLNESVIKVLNKLQEIGFETIDDPNSNRIMGFVKDGKGSRIVYNKSNRSKINNISFKNYISHELIHDILTNVKESKRFDANKDDIRNIFISLFKDTLNKTDTDSTNINNLLKYIFGNKYNDIKSNIDNLTDTNIETINDILFNQEKWQELITYAYTDRDLANTFNNLIYNNRIAKKDKVKSSLYTILRDFFNTLLKVLNLNIKEGSYLEAIETVLFNSLGGKLTTNNKGVDNVVNIAESSPTSSPVGTENQRSNKSNGIKGIISKITKTKVNTESIESTVKPNIELNQDEKEDDNDFSTLDVVDLSNYEDIKYVATGERVLRGPAILGNNSTSTLVSLTVSKSIQELYKNTEVNNNTKIC